MINVIIINFTAAHKLMSALRANSENCELELCASFLADLVILANTLVVARCAWLASRFYLSLSLCLRVCHVHQRAPMCVPLPI